ncbi:putative membrane protein [Sinorhizobium fredii]
MMGQGTRGRYNGSGMTGGVPMRADGGSDVHDPKPVGVLDNRRSLFDALNHEVALEREAPMRMHLIAAFAAVSWALPPTLREALAQAPADPDRYAYGPHMMGWYGMIFGPLFMVLLLAVLIAAVVLIVRWAVGPWHGSAPLPPLGRPDRTPLDILKERFARGEIDKNEFEERRRVLGE